MDLHCFYSLCKSAAFKLKFLILCRCIKPNPLKEPLTFVKKDVIHQLRCGGVMESVRICCAGYPTRRPMQKFFDRWVCKYCVIPFTYIVWSNYCVNHIVIAIYNAIYTTNTLDYVSKWTYTSFACCVAGRPLRSYLSIYCVRSLGKCG